MAVTVTAGAYTADIATDDAGGSGHVQITKLAISTGGSATLIPGDATNGLDVDVTRLPALPAGTNNIGDVDVATLPALPAGSNLIGSVDLNDACDLGAILEGGTQRAIVRGGAKGVTAAADVTSVAVNDDTQALAVAIVQGGGSGGTSSDFGSAFPATGTAAGFTDGTNMVAAHARTAGPNGCDRGIVVRPVGFTTPNGDSMVDDTLNGLGIVLLNQLESDQDSVSITGLVAHDAALSSNSELRPVVGGFRATSSLAGITLTADADATWAQAGLDGVQITRPHTNLESIVTGNISITDGSCTTLIAAPGAGLKTYLTSLILTNTCSTAVYVELKNAGTTIQTVPVPGDVAGAVVPFPVPVPGTANGGWGADPSAAASTVFVSAVGFTSKV